MSRNRERCVRPSARDTRKPSGASGRWWRPRDGTRRRYLRKFRPTEIIEERQDDAVTGEIAVKGQRSPIPGLRHVAEKDTPAAAAEHQRRAQTGRSPADHDDVEHLLADSSLTAAARRLPLQALAPPYE